MLFVLNIYCIYYVHIYMHIHVHRHIYVVYICICWHTHTHIYIHIYEGTCILNIKKFNKKIFKSQRNYKMHSSLTYERLINFTDNRENRKLKQNWDTISCKSEGKLCKFDNINIKYVRCSIAMLVEVHHFYINTSGGNWRSWYQNYKSNYLLTHQSWL